MAEYTERDAEALITQHLLGISKVLRDYDPKEEYFFSTVQIRETGSVSISFSGSARNPKRLSHYETFTTHSVKMEEPAMEAKDVCMVELWVDKHDGIGLRQMLYEPNERAEAAEYAKQAILKGWAVQCH